MGVENHLENRTRHHVAASFKRFKKLPLQGFSNKEVSFLLFPPISISSQPNELCKNHVLIVIQLI